MGSEKTSKAGEGSRHMRACGVLSLEKRRLKRVCSEECVGLFSRMTSDRM